MERKELNDAVTEEVLGGSIVFNKEHTTCGRNCNNQYRVNNYDAVIQYIGEHRHSMNELTMLANMLELGLIGNL